MKVDGISEASYQPKQVSETAGTQGKVSNKVSDVKVSDVKVSKIDETSNYSVDISESSSQPTNETDVIKAIEKANSHIRTYDRKLEFSIHDQTKQIMVKVINTEDESVIREIPSEKVLDMVARMWEVAGILVDEKI